MMFGSTLLPFVLHEVHVRSVLFVFIYVYWYPTRFPYHMMFLSFISNMTGITNDTGTAYPSGAPIFSLDFLLEFVLLKMWFSL